jgi:hypothetical protein
MRDPNGESDAEQPDLARQCEELRARVANLEAALQLRLRQSAAKDKLIEDLRKRGWWWRKPHILAAPLWRG